MFDEYSNPLPSVASPVPAVVAPKPVDPTGAPSSTSIDQDAPSPSKKFQPERLARGLESVSIRRIQCVGYDVLAVLEVGTMFDIFQNIHILYLQYGVLVFTGYGVLILFPSWSLVSVGTDTPYLP
ncbi:hypothetical protein Tco_0470878 [Tanacetum coccineum]